ncbi:MAG: AraC family transcriptional regulator [Fimbriimonadaceae bacterium]|nr:AraC family transcriptional regulator [Fimbriimonadaceae bacterium]
MRQDTWITRLNHSLDQIEANLHRPLGLAEIAASAYTSSFHFQRVFQSLTGFTVGSYIRSRRLSLAAVELIENRRQVGEVALEFGYESPESFSRAFRKQYGISPSLARSQRVHLSPFPRLVLTHPNSEGIIMKYEIIEKPAFRVIGVTRHFKTVDENHLSQIPAFWDEVIQSGELGKIS